MVKLFVGNIAEGVTDDELREYFANYGSVSECSVLGNYGFVHMSTDGEAEEAIKNMDKRNVRGQELNVEKSKSTGSGGRGRGGGRGPQGRNGGGYGGGGGGGFGGDNSSSAKAARRLGCTKLHVANLADGMQSRDLRMLFERYGYVAECDVVEDRKIAFVHIENGAAEAAIRGLNGREFRGLELKVQMSKNQNNSDGGSGMDGFRGSSFRGGMGRMGLRGGFGDRERGRGRGLGGMLAGFRGRRGAAAFGDSYGDHYGDDMFGDYGDEGGLGDLSPSLPSPAKDRLELLELLDRRRRLEALDPYERRLIACQDPFSLPPPPPEYLRLLRERAMVKARLPLPPTTASLTGSRASQGQSAVGSSTSSLQRALIARRAAAVAASAREKIRSSAVGLDPYGDVDASRASAEDYLYSAIGADY